MLGSVLTAMVTPFKADGSVDVDRFRELATYLVDNGSDGVVVCGTTGESPTLSDKEKLVLFAAARDAVGERASVIAGTGTYDTAHSVHLTQQAATLGVDGVLVVTPYYNKPPQRAIVRHFEAIAAASDLPIIAYNIPSPRRRQHRADHDLAPRGDRHDRRRQAGARRPRRGALHRRADPPRPLLRRRPEHARLPRRRRGRRRVSSRLICGECRSPR